MTDKQKHKMFVLIIINWGVGGEYNMYVIKDVNSRLLLVSKLDLALPEVSWYCNKAIMWKENWYAQDAGPNVSRLCNYLISGWFMEKLIHLLVIS